MDADGDYGSELDISYVKSSAELVDAYWLDIIGILLCLDGVIPLCLQYVRLWLY